MLGVTGTRMRLADRELEGVHSWTGSVEEKERGEKPKEPLIEKEKDKEAKVSSCTVM